MGEPGSGRHQAQVLRAYVSEPPGPLSVAWLMDATGWACPMFNGNPCELETGSAYR
jgi:hypothetical protein